MEAGNAYDNTTATTNNKNMSGTMTPDTDDARRTH